MDPSRFLDFTVEVRHDFPHLGPRIMILNVRRIEPEPGHLLILLHIEDATRKKLNWIASAAGTGGTRPKLPPLDLRIVKRFGIEWGLRTGRWMEGQ